AARAATGERSVVITRSTFPGSGKYAGHWLGDNQSKWSDLRHSIIGMLEFNLFGIPYIGADICGFFGDSTAELCKRWTQLGAFYPFSRNHNTIGAKRQDPGFYGEDVARASREILEIRYWLLPYLYTLFHEAHTQGSTVVRPLHHEFPEDSATYGIDRQFLWGPALLISPIVEEGQTSLTYHLPPGVWYDLLTGTSQTGSRDVTIAVTSDSKPALHVRGGQILPLQQPALNTTASRKNKFELLVVMDGRGSAHGRLFWDDGVSVDTYETGDYFLAEYTANLNSVTVNVSDNSVAETATLTYGTIKIWGVKQHVHDVTITDRGANVGWPFEWDYDPEAETLKIFNMDAPLSDSFTVNWRSVEQSPLSRVDCWPERQGGFDLPDAVKCRRRSCVYQPHSDPAVPDCFFRQSNYGYSVDGQWQQTNNGMQVTLRRVGNGPFGFELPTLVFTMEEYGDDIIRFKFDSPAGNRYQVPMKLNLPLGGARSPQYRFEVTSNYTFAFRIVRVSTGAVLFDTGVGGLVFHDQFLQISTRLPTRHVYGMGENVHKTFRRNLWYHTYPLFGRDQPTKTDDTLTHFYNHYGTHPFYQCVEDDGKAHGVLFFNSDPQDYTFSPLPMLTYRTIGGVLDFYVFLGPSPEGVVQQYTGVIGRPVMPPYWALGFQLCKYGYNSLDNLKTAVDRTRDAGIPHDVQYADIDHMSERRDFTLDNVSFAGLPDYFRQLREGGMRTIIILDPALVSNYSDYEPYQRLKAVGGFIKWPRDVYHPADMADDDGSIFGYVWPQGKTVFPDFFKSETRRVWKELIVEHRSRIDFDGLWIDMNEPAVFGTNDDRPFNWPEDVKPYWTERNGRLSDKTLCLVTKQGERDEYRHFDVHNMYGWSQTAPTLEALRRATGERGIVISRSTFVGSGHKAGHWLGDNLSSWADLRASIPGILEFNLYGFPYTGADICGHFGTASAELCKRWMQLGAFYTFSRNHNAVGNRDQDPGNFDDEVSRVSREAMETRYWLLPYVYTLFHRVSTEGGTVIRPMHHEFPTDPKALGNSRQFMWGSSLLISPVLEPNVTSLKYYIPPGAWFDAYTGALITTEGGYERTVPVKSDSRTELLVRGGSILPLQEPARNTTYSRKNPLKILVALDNAGSAWGELFWDDGVSIDTYEAGRYYKAKYTAAQAGTFTLQLKPLSRLMCIFHASRISWSHRFDHLYVVWLSGGSLHVRIEQNNSPRIENLVYNYIMILGVQSRPVSVDITDDSNASSNTFTADWRYDKEKQKITIDNIRIPLPTEFTVTWKTISDDEFSRVDCWPERQGGVDVPTADSCRGRNCAWQPHWHEKIPDCFFPKDNFGYKY
ncbi:hypothetical protein BaRGS_00018319, partial [Batillaria attramentaria]